MANTQQQYWSSGTEAQPVPIKVHNEGEFYAACRLRYQYEMSGASALQWQELAEKFQQAKGNRHSYLAEYCRMRAGKVVQ